LRERTEEMAPRTEEGPTGTRHAPPHVLACLARADPVWVDVRAGGLWREHDRSGPVPGGGDVPLGRDVSR